MSAFPQTIVPKTIPALTLWLDADDASTITTVTGVSSWRDKSGNGFNPVQATTTKQPTYTANLQGGKYGLVFDGVDDNLITASTSTLMDPETGSASIFVVSKVLSGNYSVGKGRLNNTSGSGGWAHTTLTSNSRLLAGTNTPADISGSTVYTLPQSDATIKEWKFDGSNLTYYNNGAQFGTTKTYSGSITTSSSLAIGGRATNDNYTSQYIFEVLFYKGALSTTDIANIRNYLANKWGIALS